MADAETTHRVVAPAGAGRVDKWLAEVLPLTRSRIRGLLEAGLVTVDAKVTRPSHRLVGGERVVVSVPPPPPTELVAQDIPVPLLHVDDEVAVISKPAGLVVHPAKGHADGTLVNALLHLLTEAGEDPTRPGVVHRLDMGTSGVLVVARTPEAHAALAAQFAAHTTERDYLAVVWGRPPARGSVDAPLGRHPRDRKRFAVREGGKRAVTHFERLDTAELAVPGARTGGVVSLVRCRLETGRTHQVRVHLTHLGHPLLGDPVYRRRGVKVPPVLRDLLASLDHQLLHAERLAFDHPATGERIVLRTPPPADFEAICDAAGLALP